MSVESNEESYSYGEVTSGKRRSTSLVVVDDWKHFPHSLSTVMIRMIVFESPCRTGVIQIGGGGGTTAMPVQVVRSKSALMGTSWEPIPPKVSIESVGSFGVSVSLSANGKTAVTGTPDHCGSGSDPQGWTSRQGDHLNDLFGQTADVCLDGNTSAVKWSQARSDSVDAVTNNGLCHEACFLSDENLWPLKMAVAFCTITGKIALAHTALNGQIDPHFSLVQEVPMSDQRILQECGALFKHVIHLAFT